MTRAALTASPRHTLQRAAKVTRFDGGTGRFEGVAVVYGVVDDYRSVFAPGTFTASLEDPETPPPAICWAHQWFEVVGQVTDWLDDTSALVIGGQLDDPDAVPRARQAWAQLRSGSVAQLSVGFRDVQRRAPTAEESAALPGVEEVIYKATLDEVSLVMRGAVPGAKVTGTRVGKSAAAAGVRGAGVVVAGGAPRVSGWGRPGALWRESERRRAERRSR